MSSEAQVRANRRNAQRSTGPKTPEGKEIVSQNAVTHGLSARRDVIRGEDREEFERHRREMLDDLAPVGAMEGILAGRIVSLSWRLVRAQRMQNMVFESLFTKGISDFKEEADSWLDDEDDGEPEQGRDALATDLALGRAITRDFANAKVLERLLAYEGRIEASLYKAMAELEKLRRQRRAEGATVQNKANPVCSVPVRAYPGPVEAAYPPVSRTSCPRFEGGTPSAQTPDGVTTNAQNKANGPAGEMVGTAHPADAKQSQSTEMGPAAQNEANLAQEGLAAQNKANLPGQAADAVASETAAGPMPVGT